MKQKIIIAICFIICLVVIYKLYNDNTELKLNQMTTQEVQSVEKVKDAINQNSNTHISDYQAQEVVKEIHTIVTTQKEPDKIIITTGKDYEAVSKDYATQQKADAIIVTTENDKKLEDIKESDNVTINQYNIKAYPKKMLSIGAYSDKDIVIDYQNQIKVFGKQAYIGPSVKFNTSKQDVAVGAKLTIPF